MSKLFKLADIVSDISSENVKPLPLKPTTEDKAVDAFCKNVEELRKFAIRMDFWLTVNKYKIRVQLAPYAMKEVDEFPYDVLKACFRDLDIPCNQFETHIICRLLDKSNKRSVSLKQLEKGLIHYVTSFLKFEAEENETNVNIMEYVKEYVYVIFWFLPFDDVATFTGNFAETFSTDTFIHKLHEVVAERTGFSPQTIGLYPTRDVMNEKPMFAQFTLQQYDIKGGPFDQPIELILYCTVHLGPCDCPILLREGYVRKGRFTS